MGFEFSGFRFWVWGVWGFRVLGVRGLVGLGIRVLLNPEGPEDQPYNVCGTQLRNKE